MDNKLNVQKLGYEVGEPVEDLGIGGVLIMRRNVNK